MLCALRARPKRGSGAKKMASTGRNWTPKKCPKSAKKVAKNAKNCLHFYEKTPFFSQVLHTPPLIFRKHRRFRGARKRGSGAPKPPSRVSPGAGEEGVSDLNRGYPPKGGGTPKGTTPQRGSGPQSYLINRQNTPKRGSLE